MNNKTEKSEKPENKKSNENITSKIDGLSKKNEYNINIDLESFLQEFEKIAEIKSQYKEEKKESKYVMSGDEVYAEIANYDMNYSVKELAIICDFYGFDTLENLMNMDKLLLIEKIMIFENKTENIVEVYRRKQYWNYMEDLKADPYFKKYIIEW